MYNVSLNPFCVLNQVDSILAEATCNRIEQKIKLFKEDYDYDEMMRSPASFEDLENFDIDELHDKYCDFDEEPDYETIKRRIEDEVGYSYQEYLYEKEAHKKAIEDDLQYQYQNKIMDDGRQIEKAFYKELMRTKPYTGNGSNLSGTNKVCTIYFPYEYYSDMKIRDYNKIYYNIKDFPSNTKFVKIIFGHHHDDDGTIYSSIQIPGSNLEYIVATNASNHEYKIDKNADKHLTRRLTKDGLSATISFIMKYSSLYHSYPNKETIAYIKAYAYNTSEYTESLPDELYYIMGDDYGDFKRSFK